MTLSSQVAFKGCGSGSSSIYQLKLGALWSNKIHSGLFSLFSEHGQMKGAKYYYNYDPCWTTFINRLLSLLPPLKHFISKYTNLLTMNETHSGLFCLFSEHGEMKGAKYYYNYDPFWTTFISRLFSLLPPLKTFISKYMNSFTMKISCLFFKCTFKNEFAARGRSRSINGNFLCCCSKLQASL